MINAAGIAGESDLNNLQQRVEKAVFGYLDLVLESISISVLLSKAL